MGGILSSLWCSIKVGIFIGRKPYSKYIICGSDKICHDFYKNQLLFTRITNIVSKKKSYIIKEESK